MFSLGSIGAVVLAGSGFRQGWWHFLKGLQIAEWGVYAAALGLVVSLAGAIRSRPAGPVFWDMPNPTEYPGARFAALQRDA